MLFENEASGPEDRDGYLDGDDSVLTRYGFDPDDTSPGIRAIIISVHPERRNEWDEISDRDDEQIERLERQRELEDRRRQAEDAERRQLEAIQMTGEQVPPAPANAYSPEDE